MTRTFALLATLSLSFAEPALAADPPASAVSLTGFECGKLVQSDLGWFSDTMLYRGERRELIAGCFVIRHPRGIVLWDTGLPSSLVGGRDPSGEMSLDHTIAQSLARMGLQPGQITHVGISHYHGDHTGGAAGFPQAELLIGKGDWDLLKGPGGAERGAAQLAPWISGGGRVRPVEGDLDLFGDGTVIMLAMPGHTPGHHTLLVKLPRAGYVLLSGDQYHFRANRAVRGVPSFNADRADTLASHDRFETIARNLNARVVIQHDPRDLAELPAFPSALE